MKPLVRQDIIDIVSKKLVKCERISGQTEL